MRFLDYRGSYRLGDVEASALEPSAVRRIVGLVEQRPWLFDEDVRQNLLFARDTATDEDLLDVLDRVGLREWLAVRGGLDAKVGERGALVSGGQAQRIALARAMLADFPVLVLDEPTASVDPARADALLRDLTDAAARSGRTVVLISHTGAPAGLIDRTVILDAGTLVEGAPREAETDLRSPQTLRIERSAHGSCASAGEPFLAARGAIRSPSTAPLPGVCRITSLHEGATVNHRSRNTVRAGAITASVAVCATLAIAGPAQAAVVTDTSALREAVTLGGVMGHLDAFQAIADANDDNRAAGTSGHEASLAYVQEQLEGAGYHTVVQDFTYERTNFTGTSLSRTSPDPDVAYTLGIDYFPMDFSGGGNVTAPVTAVDVNLVGDHASTSGCEAADFAGFPAGNIALIQRGSCDFSVKATTRWRPVRPA